MINVNKVDTVDFFVDSLEARVVGTEGGGRCATVPKKNGHKKVGEI